MAAAGSTRSAAGGARSAGTRHGARDDKMTPAQWYCLLAGAALLLAGITGFIAEPSFAQAQERGSLLGFDVNGWHNIVHVASGLLLLASFRSRAASKVVALAFGLTYGLVTIIGLIDGSDIFGVLPINGADNVLHLALSAVGIFAALASPATKRRHAAGGATEDRSTRFSRDHDTLTGAPRDDRTITRNR